MGAHTGHVSASVGKEEREPSVGAPAARAWQTEVPRVSLHLGKSQHPSAAAWASISLTTHHPESLHSPRLQQTCPVEDAGDKRLPAGQGTRPDTETRAPGAHYVREIPKDQRMGGESTRESEKAPLDPQFHQEEDRTFQTKMRCEQLKNKDKHCVHGTARTSAYLECWIRGQAGEAVGQPKDGAGQEEDGVREAGDNADRRQCRGGWGRCGAGQTSCSPAPSGHTGGLQCGSVLDQTRP